jgi:hypothetical protein
VPPGSTVVGIPGRIVLHDGKPVTSPSRYVEMPDPTSAVIQQLAERVADLERRLTQLGAPTQALRAPAVNSAIFDDVSPSI